jgi:hypothetical protein
VLAGPTILFVYKARFAKDNSVKISVNFMKEKDKFKLMQIRFDKLVSKKQMPIRDNP